MEKKKERFEGGYLKRESLKPHKSLKQQAIFYDQYRMSIMEIFVALLKGVGICGLLSYVYYRSMPVFFCSIPGALLLIPIERKRLKEKRKQMLASQFKESLVALSSALSAGYAMENALEITRQEMILLYGEGGLITHEFLHMVQQIKMNRPVEQVLNDFGKRSGLEDIENFSQVFMVAKRSGGDLSQIMKNTAETIRDKLQVKEEIRTMTASRRFEQKIMNLIPFFIVFYVEGSSPGFFVQMYETIMGRVLMSGCLITYMISYFMSWKILDIKV